MAEVNAVWIWRSALRRQSRDKEKERERGREKETHIYTHAKPTMVTDIFNSSPVVHPPLHTHTHTHTQTHTAVTKSNGTHTALDVVFLGLLCAYLRRCAVTDCPRAISSD